MVELTSPTAQAHIPDDGMIVDLSMHANKLMANQDISMDLTDEQNHRLVEYIREIERMSYSRISRRYDHWKLADRAHDVYVKADATRFREKAVIADTRAIADTVLTYLMAALGGRNPMFPLEGLNRKSRKAAAILEQVMHQQMRRTAGEARLAQHLLDCIRYGFAPTKVTWDAKSNTNKITNFDPRRVFPDPRVQWGDWENMQYCVFTSTASYDALVQTGLYPKLKSDKKYRYKMTSDQQAWEAHRWHAEEGRGLSIDPLQPNERSTGRSNSSYFSLGNARIIDEAWVKLAGYQVGMPNIDVIWLLMTVVDESLIIRMHLNPYGRQFPVVIGGLFHDSHKTYAQSLYDLLLPLHDIATWLLRSRIDNVQAAMNNLIFVDPTKVAVSDLIDRNPWGIIRSLPGQNPGDGVFIANVPDITRGHWSDIGALSEMKQRLSAASDAQQGMPTPGSDRTTAYEVQRLTQLGSQRLGVLSRIISATSIRPLVRMSIENIQDSLAYNGSIRMAADTVNETLRPMITDGYLDYDSAALQGDIEYLVVDGTLPIEPSRSPQSWLNAVQVASQSGLGMELDLKAMTLEAVRSMGISDIDRFRIPPEQLQREGPSPSQQMELMEKARGASVQPQEQIDREVERGNIIPMRSQQ
ncbi:MAG: hypothetical protein CMQ41_05555 [Gammaproteobacteria bacterium]|nr:hypothetical protein [Gammaproteobacteria bacterium]